MPDNPEIDRPPEADRKWRRILGFNAVKHSTDPGPEMSRDEINATIGNINEYIEAFYKMLAVPENYSQKKVELIRREIGRLEQSRNKLMDMLDSSAR